MIEFRFNFEEQLREIQQRLHGFNARRFALRIKVNKIKDDLLQRLQEYSPESKQGHFEDEFGMTLKQSWRAKTIRTLTDVAVQLYSVVDNIILRRYGMGRPRLESQTGDAVIQSIEKGIRQTKVIKARHTFRFKSDLFSYVHEGQVIKPWWYIFKGRKWRHVAQEGHFMLKKTRAYAERTSQAFAEDQAERIVRELLLANPARFR